MGSGMCRTVRLGIQPANVSEQTCGSVKRLDNLPSLTRQFKFQFVLLYPRRPKE
jgi:hypothetical protein